MAKFENKTTVDGWMKVSEGAAQIQIIESTGTLGIAHSNTVLTTEPYDFTIDTVNIEVSLIPKPCYVKVLSNGSVTFGAEDIS